MLCIIVHAMAFLSWIHCPQPFSVLQQQLFAALSPDNDSFSLPSSVSIPLFHCLFTSFHRSMQHHSFSSGSELLCLLSASLSHTSSRLAITAYLLSLPPFPPSPYLTGYIGSSVCCLGLWQPVSDSGTRVHGSMCGVGNVCVCQGVCCLSCVCSCPVSLILLMKWKHY